MDTDDESGTSTTILDIGDKGDGLKGEEEPNMALPITQGPWPLKFNICAISNKR